MSGNVRLDEMERAQFVGLKKAFALLEHEHGRLNQQLNDQRRKDRLYLAGLAMAGMLASNSGPFDELGPVETTARHSVEYADAVLARLEDDDA